MSIIDTIVSALRSLTGGGTEKSTESKSTGSQSEGQVSVEHDPDSEATTPDASTEAAVKGGDADAGGPEDGVAAGTDATASTGTLVDEETGKEPAEAVGGPSGADADETPDGGDIGGEDDAGSDDPDAGSDDPDAGSDEPDETEVESADESDDTDDAEPATEGSTEPTETITGIGPAYAGRLEGIGIGTVGELAAADAAEVAEGIDVSEARVRDWIGRARDE